MVAHPPLSVRCTPDSTKYLRGGILHVMRFSLTVRRKVVDRCQCAGQPTLVPVPSSVLLASSPEGEWPLHGAFSLFVFAFPPFFFASPANLLSRSPLCRYAACSCYPGHPPLTLTLFLLLSVFKAGRPEKYYSRRRIESVF